MSVDGMEVARIASLARLRFDDEEIERLTAELNGILEHVEVLRSLAGDLPRDAPADPDPRPSTRAGEDGEPDALAAGLGAIAPLLKDGFFVVPPPPGVHEEGEPS